MNNYTLADLALFGVVWELQEPVASEIAEHKSAISNHQSERNIVIPTANLLSHAESAAAAAKDFNELCIAVGNFPHPLKSFARTISPRIPSPEPRIIIITDSPSSDDDASGNILSGAAGEMLDKMLSAIGVARDDVAIIPLVFWRPPGGRTITEEEYSLCRPFFERAIELMIEDCGLRIVLCLGSGVEKQLNQFSILNPQSSIFTIPHPNYLILKPDAKKDAWTVLQEIQKVISDSD